MFRMDSSKCLLVPDEKSRHFLIIDFSGWSLVLWLETAGELAVAGGGQMMMKMQLEGGDTLYWSLAGHLTHVTVPRRTSHASHKYQHNHRASAVSSSTIQQTHNLLYVYVSSLVSRIIYFNLSQFHDFYEFYFPVLPSVLGGEPGTGAWHSWKYQFHRGTKQLYK